MTQLIKFYFDEHMPRVVAKGLTRRGYTVIMAADVDMLDKDDDTEHLPYATQQGAVLVTRDNPFASRAQQRTDHAGLICWTGKDNDIGGMVRKLSEFAENNTAEKVIGQVFWIKP
jgi:predicted nuclease of predicted toxin-antitoxin system